MHKVILLIFVIVAIVYGKCHDSVPVVLCGENEEYASIACVKDKWFGNGNYCLAELPGSFELRDTVVIHGNLIIQNPLSISHGKIVVNSDLIITAPINIRGSHIQNTVLIAKNITLLNTNIRWLFDDYKYMEYSKLLNLYCAHEAFANYFSNFTVYPQFKNHYNPNPKLKSKITFNTNDCPGQFVGYRYELAHVYKVDDAITLAFLIPGIFVMFCGAVVIFFIGIYILLCPATPKINHHKRNKQNK